RGAPRPLLPSGPAVSAPIVPGTAIAKSRGTPRKAGGCMDTTARIGATLVIKGELRAQEDVAIAGRVEGSIHVAGHTVTVQPGGHVAADITARHIIGGG